VFAGIKRLATARKRPRSGSETGERKNVASAFVTAPAAPYVVPYLVHASISVS